MNKDNLESTLTETKYGRMEKLFLLVYGHASGSRI